MQTKRMPSKVLLTAPLFVLVALSGCLEGLGLDEEESNQAPEARLEVEKDVGWAGDEFIFDANGSSDADGQIVRWHFDFGDGQTLEVTDEEEAASVEHIYVEGGEYIATVTVTDDGADQTGALTDSAQARIAVNEEQEVPERAVYATPIASNQSSTASTDHEARNGSDRFELDLELESLLVAGSSDVTVRVLAPSGDVLVEDNVTLAAGSAQNISLGGDLEETGDLTVEVTAGSGAAAYNGTFAVFYDEGF